MYKGRRRGKGRVTVCTYIYRHTCAYISLKRCYTAAAKLEDVLVILATDDTLG